MSNHQRISSKQKSWIPPVVMWTDHYDVGGCVGGGGWHRDDMIVYNERVCQHQCVFVCYILCFVGWLWQWWWHQFHLSHTSLDHASVVSASLIIFFNHLHRIVDESCSFWNSVLLFVNYTSLTIFHLSHPWSSLWLNLMKGKHWTMSYLQPQSLTIKCFVACMTKIYLLSK